MGIHVRVCVFVLACFCCVRAVRLCVSTSAVRAGYRLKASPDQDSMKVLYYIEKDLAQFPSAKMAARKRKPAQPGPVSFVCVAAGLCPCRRCLSFVCMPSCAFSSASFHIIISFNSI